VDSYSWIGTNGNAATGTNWSPTKSGDVGLTGTDCAVYDGVPATYPLPTLNLPTSEDMSFTFTKAYVGDIPTGADSLNTGVLTINHADAVISIGDNPGNCPATTVTAGTLNLTKGIDGAMTIGVAGIVNMNCPAGPGQDDAVANAGTIVVTGAVPIKFNYTVTNTGTINCSAAGASLDMNSALGDLSLGLLGSGGTILLGSTSACTGVVNVTNCTWTVTLGATWTGDIAGAYSLGGGSANLDWTFNKAGATFTMADSIVRDLTVTDGTATLTGVTCRTLTLAAAKVLTLAGQIRLGLAPVFGAGSTLRLGSAAIIPTTSLTFDAAVFDADHCDHTACCMFSNGPAVLTIDNLPAQATPIHAYCGAVDGGTNAPDSIVFHDVAPGATLVGVAA